MPRRDSRWDDEPEDEFENDDFNAGEDWTDESSEMDESPTLPCPRCGREVYDDAPYCPHCDADLAEAAERNPPRKPVWIIVGTLACLWIFWRWILMR